MSKFFFTFLLSIFSVILLATGTNISPEQKKIIVKIEFTVEASQIEGFLRKSIHQIKNGKPGGATLKPIEYDIISRRVEDWIKYRWIIADAGLSKKWLKKVHELLVYIAKKKRYINASEFSGNIKTAKYKQAVKYYDIAYERLVKLSKKPVKVSSKVQRRYKLKKAMWQKAMRKKYKIKGKIQEEF